MKQFLITGMSCAACSARVEKAVSAVSGVTSCAVNLLTNSMVVEGTAADREIIAAVIAAGYGASVKGEKTPSSERLADTQTPKLIRRLVASVGFLLVLMYISMGHVMWRWPLPWIADNPIAIGLVQLLLTAIILVINQKFFISGFQGLLHKAPNMDTLVALGSGAAFVYSTYVLFAMTGAEHPAHYLHDLYFESAAMIVALITVGKALESFSKGKTTSALQGLMDLAPQTATVLLDNTPTVVPIEQVQVGDLFVVKPGEQFPVDGVITDGNGAVNESALTGESIPVDKTVGDTVSAATLNQSGYLTCRATHVGEDTTLSKIIQMVSDAASTKAPIAKVADKVSGIFVPIVLAIALLTTIVWLFFDASVGYALARGISVLVISCPCALGLATPVAIMVGNGVGAKNGILFKTAQSLEQTGKVQMVVLDKTGTITTGQPTVTDCVPYGDATAEQLLAAAYSLEQKSEHPLAKAILQKGEEEKIKPYPITDFKVLPGNGLTATHEDRPLYGGNAAYIGSVIDLPDTVAQQAQTLAKQGKTPLFFAQGETLLGIVAVADSIKPESPAAIARLKNMGLRVIMLTGDNALTAAAIGEQTGVDQVVAGVLPDGKEEVIRTLQQQGPVAMVGDGINDAPALTRADVGIAIGAGTDIAIDAADVVLMNSRLSDVPAAIALSRFALRNIHQNLFWAFFYNAIGIPLAAGVFTAWIGWSLNPMFAAAAMSLSSFCVVTNALRLNLARIYNERKDKKRIFKKEKKTMQKEFTVVGMMCPHCEANVKLALEAIAGIDAVVADHTQNKVTVTVSGDVSDDVIIQTITDKGYTVQ